MKCTKHFTSFFPALPYLSFNPSPPSFSFSVSLLPLIHGTQHWHIHNQTDLTLHILPQWERRRLRQELYTRTSVLISCSESQAPPPSIRPSLCGFSSFFLSFFFLSLSHHSSPLSSSPSSHFFPDSRCLSFPLIGFILAWSLRVTGGESRRWNVRAGAGLWWGTQITIDLLAYWNENKKPAEDSIHAK